jgi:tetratricopeptide (TPR) repeat protein
MLTRIRANPDDWQQHILRGLSLAYAGQRTEAIREGEQAVALRPLARDASFGAYALFSLARVYALVGEPAQARATLDRVLTVPFYATPAWVAIDPAFRALRR